MQDRVNLYTRFAGVLGVSTGGNRPAELPFSAAG
jgi:hypothetical protein